jgi:hypothetical protein
MSVALRGHVTPRTTGVGPIVAPDHTRLLAPFPNPLARSSLLGFDLARATDARLEIFDLTGRRLATITDRFFEAGRHRFEWDGRTEDGTSAVPGLYFVKLTARGFPVQAARLAVAR